MLNFSRPAYCRRSRSAIPTATRDPGLFLFCAPPLAAASWARKKRRLPDAEKVVSFFSCFLRNSPLASRLVPPESLANPRFSRFLPSHPALSRVSQLSCLFTVGSDGELESCTADFDLDLVLGLPVTETENAQITAKLQMDMQMDVNATGDDVRISYPSFSNFEDLTPVLSGGEL